METAATYNIIYWKLIVEEIKQKEVQIISPMMNAVLLFNYIFLSFFI